MIVVRIDFEGPLDPLLSMTAFAKRNIDHGDELGRTGVLGVLAQGLL
jgi:hypothetical protein